MHHEGFRCLLQRLNRLALPAQGLAVYGEEGEAYFANLECGVLVGLVGEQRRESVGWRRHTRREKGSLSSSRSVVRW